MNEDKIDVNRVLAGLAEANEIDEYGNFGVRIEACIRQQQAEIEALKKQNSAMANVLLGFGMTSVTWVGE